MWSAYVAQCHTLYSLTKLCRKSGMSLKTLGVVSLNLYFIFISLLSFVPCLSESWQCSFMRFLLRIPVFHPGCCQHSWRVSCPAQPPWPLPTECPHLGSASSLANYLEAYLAAATWWDWWRPSDDSSHNFLTLDFDFGSDLTHVYMSLLSLKKNSLKSQMFEL